MDRQAGPYFWFSSETPSKGEQVYSPGHHDLLTFLAGLQRLKVDLLPITWQPKLDVLGHGGTAGVSQSAVDGRTSFAYKRMYTEKGSSKNFKMLTAEVAVLKSKFVVGHSNIVQLEGICWEIESKTYRILPVLVFEKADLGDMRRFMATEEGRNVDIDTRIKWCVELAGALHSLHSGDIIHGDIKPGNLLVFKDERGRHIVKTTDFGHATSSGNDIYLPHTWPWTAPEWHPRVFRLTQAKRTDIYSFGMVCLWVLFASTPAQTESMIVSKITMPPDESSHRQTVDLMKQKDELPDFARKRMDQETSLSDAQRGRLMDFFGYTIRLDPNLRQLDLQELSKVLSGECTHNWPTRDDLRDLADHLIPISRFKVAPFLHQFFMAIPEVRMATVKALEEKARDCKCHLLSEDCAEKRNAALQLAFCYELGFGFPRDEKLSESWLKQSTEKPEVLSSIVKTVIQESQVPTFQEGLFKRLWDEGHISKFDFADYHRGRQTLDEVESQYRREITDIKHVLGEKHGAVLTLKSSLAGILMEEGRLPQAAELEEQVLKANLAVLGPFNHATIMTTGNLALIYSHLGKWELSENLHRELLHRCEMALGPDHPSTIGAMANLGSVLRLRGRYQEAEDLDVNMVARQQRVFGSEHPESISAVLNLAATYRSRNHLDKAAEIEERIVPIARRVLQDGHPVLIRAESNLALTYDRQGRWKDSEELLFKVLESSEKALGSSHPATMANMHNLALLYRSQGQWKQAEDLLVRVIEIQSEKLGPEHPDSLTSMGQLAQTFSEQGRLFEAQELLANTLEKMKQVFGEENPKTLATGGMVGAIWIKLGRYGDAETILREVIDAETRVNGQDHPSTLTTKQNLATAYMSNQKYDAAEELLQKVLEARKKILGEDAAPTMVTMGSLSSTYRYQRRLKEALEMNREVVRRMQKVLGNEHPHTLASLGLQANILIDTKSFADAEILLDPLIQTQKSLLGPEHPDTLNTIYTYGLVCLNQGRNSEAVQLLHHVLEVRTRVLGPEHPDTRKVAHLVDVSDNELPHSLLSG